MKKLNKWVKLPTGWIEDGRLEKFKWTKGSGANASAALMALIVIAHHMDDVDGMAKLTYNELSQKTTLSRAKISLGLDMLDDLGIIKREPCGQSTYQICDYDPDSGWAKLPTKGLYRNDVVDAFTTFHLRRVAELDALKLYFLFVAQRDRKTNSANIGYEKIEEKTGVPRNRIRSALTVLGANGLIHVDHVPSDESIYGIANRYRLTHLDSYNHAGTTGREEDVGFLSRGVGGFDL